MAQFTVRKRTSSTGNQIKSFRKTGAYYGSSSSTNRTVVNLRAKGPLHSRTLSRTSPTSHHAYPGHLGGNKWNFSESSRSHWQTTHNVNAAKAGAVAVGVGAGAYAFHRRADIKQAVHNFHASHRGHTA